MGAGKRDGRLGGPELFAAHYPRLAGWCARVSGDDATGHALAAEAFASVLLRGAAADDQPAALYAAAAALVGARGWPTGGLDPGAVDPLTPPPGQYDRICGLVRRRRRVRALATVGVLAVVAAAGAAVATSSRTTPPGDRHPSPAPSAPVEPTSGVVPPVPAGAAPAGFEPVSVSFVSAAHGFALGTAPCRGWRDCTAVVETTDGARSWHAVAAPVLPVADAALDKVRFLDDRTGWIFGVGLWATRDGGRTWRLETDAVVADLAIGRTTAYRLQDGQVLQWAGRSAPDRWLPLPPLPRLATEAAPDTLAVADDAAYAVLDQGDRATVARTAGAGHGWTRHPLPCTVQPPLVTPRDGGALLAVCQDDAVWRSTDGGATFTRTPARLPRQHLPPDSFPPATVVAARAGVLAAGLDIGGGPQSGLLVVSADSGGHWRVVGGSELGFTDVELVGTLGVAVPSRELRELFVSRDGGHTWIPYVFR